MIVRWNLRLFENNEEIVKDQKLLGVPEPVVVPGAIASRCAEQFFEGGELEAWDEWFGIDCGDGDVIVEITEPPVLAGEYRVHLELRVRAMNVEKIAWPKEKKA